MNTLPLTTQSPDQTAENARLPAPAWWRPGLLIFLLGCIALLAHDFVQSDEWWVMTCITIASGLILLPTIWKATGRDGVNVLSDHILVLASTFVLYFVIGALLIPLGPKDQVDYVLAYYDVNAPLALRVAAVNCMGLGLALVSASLTSARLPQAWARSVVEQGRFIPFSWMLAATLTIGGTSAVYVFMFDLGGFAEVPVPGIVRTASQLLLVAIVLCAAARGRSSAWMLSLAVSLAMLQAAMGLMQFSKLGAMLPLAALLAGLTWRKGSRKLLFVGVSVLLALFVFIAEATSSGRNLIFTSAEDSALGRAAFLYEAFANPDSSILDGDYRSWTRLAYLPSQAAAIDLHDANQGGDDYLLLGWALVPRFLFPDKPIMTGSGREFHFKLTGSETSSTGQGVFVNAYYELGWWGVFVVGIVIGCMLALTSSFALAVFTARAFIWIPLALLGIMMALRIDGHFLADYWGTFILFIYAIAIGAILGISSIGRERRR